MLDGEVMIIWSGGAVVQGHFSLPVSVVLAMVLSGQRQKVDLATIPVDVIVHQ